ncbi:enoyl-CoA hydratase-related protein [Pseudooceanicola sp. C21-150M6]|uniref:enoyl-CoA hydratase-related protein n=1 Tax=Pseudooceanicola sp. C21-150M6 TaxID=3434355 RepID=UPI003D7F7277
MAEHIIRGNRRRIAVLRIDNPPLNKVNRTVRLALLRACEEIEADREVDGVVLMGGRGVFASLMPDEELDAGAPAPRLAEVCRRIEGLSKPVVAMLSGQVAGAGTDLALAAHARIATESTSFGFPEVSLGYCPSGGATQRLPRLIGCRSALHLLTEGRPMRADAPECSGLIDRFFEGGAQLDGAVTFAEELARTGDWTRSRDRWAGLSDVTAHFEAADDMIQRSEGPRLQARRYVAELVRASVMLPFDAGCAMEESYFDELLAQPLSRGLRRAQSSEAAAMQAPGLASRASIFGVTPANGLAERLAGTIILAGSRVIVQDPMPEVLTRFVEDLSPKVEARVEMRVLASGVSCPSLVSPEPAPEALAGADIVFVAAPDDATHMQAALQRLAPSLRDSATILLCLTDHLDPAPMVPDWLRPRVMALGFADRSYPARLAELSVGPQVNPAVLDTARTALRGLGRRVVVSRAGQGMIEAGLIDALVRAADALVRAGLDPARIEQVLRSRGYARGPYGIVLNVGPSYQRRADRDFHVAGLSSALIDQELSLTLNEGLIQGMSRLGASFGRPELAEHGAALDDAAIFAAIDAALVVAGARLIEAGTAARSSDIDLAMLHGLGYPRDRGGPMAAADIEGLFQTVLRLKSLSAIDADIWGAGGLLLDLQRNGRRFGDLDMSQAEKVPA